MTRIVLESRVGGDGVLHLELPLGPSEAGQAVRVTVEPVVAPGRSAEEWQRAVWATAGRWQGEFERPPQGEFEEREPLA
ncbi:MAG TPA: hypothetical protein VJ739_10515 [Gemmataceae bacterium]|nr:hypothetical protein [Gemmataceae bacterium]